MECVFVFDSLFALHVLFQVLLLTDGDTEATFNFTPVPLNPPSTADAFGTALARVSSLDVSGQSSVPGETRMVFSFPRALIAVVKLAGCASRASHADWIGENRGEEGRGC